MALPGDFRGGRIFPAFNEAEILKKFPCGSLLTWGEGVPLSGFWISGIEEGDGARWSGRDEI
jgi:hypothetical protein